MSEACVVGVDLGGTNVRAQVFAADGQPATEAVFVPSRAQEGVAATLDALAEVIQLAVEKAGQRAAAVGLAIPGHVDNAAGFVRWSPNFGEERDGILYYWKDVDIRGPLQARLGPLPIVMGNDANCAALGEYVYGSGEGKANCLVMFTLGTGVGGGVVFGPASLDGDVAGRTVLVGGNKGGAELGHMLIQMGGVVGNSGAYGPLESYCQADAIAERATNMLRRGVPSVLMEMCGGDLSLVRPKMIAEAARQGDAMALQVWEEVGRYLGAGAGVAINIFAPDVVAFGGQVAKAWEFMAPWVIRQARDTAIPSLFGDAKIVQAKQLETAGILGAAALAQTALKS